MRMVMHSQLSAAMNVFCRTHTAAIDAAGESRSSSLQQRKRNPYGDGPAHDHQMILRRASRMFNLLWIVEMGETFAPSLFPDSTLRSPDGHPLPSQGAPSLRSGWPRDRSAGLAVLHHKAGVTQTKFMVDLARRRRRGWSFPQENLTACTSAACGPL